MNLPDEYKNVMITYIGAVRVRDKYYDHYEQQEVTRRAFYSKSDGYYDNSDNWIETPEGYYNVPQYWTTYNGYLVPRGFWSYGRVLPSNIISWKYES